MLKCTETVTIVQQHAGRTEERYTCTVLRGASWCWKDRVQMGDTGLRSARMLQCRIPTQYLPPDLAVQPGNKIVRGEIHAVSGAEFAALGRTHEAAVVLDVHRNLFGPTPHIYIEGG